MVVKLKEKFGKTRQVNKMMKVKSTFYEDKEMRDIMIEFYLIKKIPIISPLVVYNKHMTSVARIGYSNKNYKI